LIFFDFIFGGGSFGLTNFVIVQLAEYKLKKMRITKDIRLLAFIGYSFLVSAPIIVKIET